MNPVTSPILTRRENFPNDSITISSDKASESSAQNADGSLASALDKNSAAQLVEVYRSSQLPNEISTVSKPDIEETNDAQKFHNAINDAKNSGKEEDVRSKTFGTKDSKWYGAAVHTYPPEEYSKMRLFLSSNGLCGFALKDVDVVSVFKHSNCPKGALDIIMPKAIKEGGRRLDCFSIKTALPTMYASYGFIPVAKVKFDPKEAPENWNYARDGSPDIIFMVYDQSVTQTIEKDFFKLKTYIEKLINSLDYSSFEEAIERQKLLINNQK